MHNPRHEHDNFRKHSPVAVSRLRNLRFDFGDEPYMRMSRSPCSRRSLSPICRGGGVGRRVWEGERRSNSLEKRVYSWDLVGCRSDRVKSRSPPIENVREWPNYGIRSRSPPIENVREWPNYGIRSRSPPIEKGRKRPNYGMRSRSLSIGQIREMPSYGVDISRKDQPLSGMHRPHDLYEFMDHGADVNARLRSNSRVVREDLDGMLGQESMNMEVHGTGRELYGKVGHPLKNTESAGIISLTSMNMDLDRFQGERVQSLNPLLSDKLTYDKGEKLKFHSRDAPMMVPHSRSLDFTEASQFKDFGITSRNSRVNIPTSHWDGPPLPADEYFGGSAKLTEHTGYGDYRERLILDSGRKPEAERKDLDVNKREPFSPLKAEYYLYNRAFLGDSDIVDIGRDSKLESNPHNPRKTDSQNYLFSRPGIQEANDHPSVETHRSSERIDYGSRPIIRDPVKEHYDTTEFSHREITNGSLWNPSLEKQSTPNNIRMSRSSNASRAGQYVDTVTAQGKKVSREHEIIYFVDSTERNAMLPITSNYGLARDAIPIYHKERVRSPEFRREAEMHSLSDERMRPSEFYCEIDMHRHSEERMRLLEYNCETEMHRHSEKRRRSLEFDLETEVNRHFVGTRGFKGEEYGTYNISHRVPKRKHQILDEEMDWSDSREVIPRKWNSSSRTQEDDRSEEWNHQHTGSSYSSKRVAYDQEVDRRYRRFSDRTDTRRLSTYLERASSYELNERVRKHSIKGHRSGDKYSKGHLKSGSASFSKPYQYDGKHVHPKPQNVWIRNKDGNKVDAHNDVGQSQNQEAFRKSEPNEDSEEFKQLVQNHYLFFTRKLNDNSAVRRRYTEQGRAGSLFCIVCGRSESKEFTDTRRLATHAYMSHKDGLRAQHLGLHKAICVLLGWKNVVPPNVVTWFPETISNTEALAQKEDLIIWPPVVLICDGSTSDHVSVQQKGMTVEALEEFIRGKGVSGGKVKIANNSVIVVKFLGTFSGVLDAEKLHKYFVENNYGRIDFEKITSSKRKTSKITAGKGAEGKVDELQLYGYMGIAEDLDEVDFDTRKKCSIRSKKEIQDIVDAPVKTE